MPAATLCNTLELGPMVAIVLPLCQAPPGKLVLSVVLEPTHISEAPLMEGPITVIAQVPIQPADEV